LRGLRPYSPGPCPTEKLPSNPATGITIKLGKQAKLRGKGFTDAEAKAILKAALNLTRGGETAGTFAAKGWVPWLAAYTGARVGELAQLRKLEGDLWTIRLTPEAGTIKTNEARTVVLHPHLVERGFPAFVETAPTGHLFLKVAANGDVLGPLQGLKNRLAESSRSIVTDPNVAPMHGWRHRFKTVGMEAGIPTRILEANPRPRPEDGCRGLRRGDRDGDGEASEGGGVGRVDRTVAEGRTTSPRKYSASRCGGCMEL
jgi:integrase